MKKLTVASVQFEHKDGQAGENLAKIRGFVKQVRSSGTDLIVFPECCISGMTFLRDLSRIELLDIAESVPNGPSTRELSRLAVENEIMIGAGLVEVGDDGEIYNTYVVAMPNGDHHSHRKLHCFISPHMKSGSQLLTFDTHQGWRIGVLTCYDCNLPENARMMALKGAHLLLAPHQTGGFYFSGRHGMGVIEQQLWDNRDSDSTAIEAEFRGEKGREWIMTWLPARAYDNGMFLVFSNGVGLDGNEIRTGNSAILDPYGRILAETNKAQDDLIVATLDSSLLDKTYGRMFIRTRRPELYAPLTDRTQGMTSMREFYQEQRDSILTNTKT